MKRKDFVKAVLDILNVSENLRYPFSCFSDKLTDGTKVLRIKRFKNVTDYSYDECQKLLQDRLLQYTNIKDVTVRRSQYGYLDFVIQINYTGDLPDLNEKPEQVVETKPEQVVETKPEQVVETKEAAPAYTITELPNGMFKVETPLGVGYATDKADLDKMMVFLEGVQAGMQMGNGMVDDEFFERDIDRDIDPKEEFVQNLKDIDVTEKRPAEWWNEAQDIMDRYMASYGQYFDSYEEIFELANEVFKEVY